MGWIDIWTTGAWGDVSHASLAKQTELARAVSDFARTGSGTFARDGSGTGEGRLIVGHWRLSIARKDKYTYSIDDGEYVTVRDAIVVLGAVAIDPDGG